MMNRNLLKVLGIVAVVVIAFYVMYPVSKTINLGLDLKGGSHIVLQAVGTPEAPLTSDSIDRVIAVIRNRIDQFGVTEPLIQREGNTRVIIDLPGVKDPEAAIDLIGKTALLEFKQVIKVGDKAPIKPKRSNYSSQKEYEQALKNYEDAMKEYNKMLAEFRKIVASHPGYSLHFNRDKTIPYILGKTYLTGKYLKDARTAYDRFSRPVVSLEFNSVGAKKFEEATRLNVQRPLAIVLDGVVISAPVVQEVIMGGRAQITGNFTLREAQKLAILLRAGALPVKVKIIENRTIGPTLGRDSIHRGVIAGIVGVILVLGFMIVYYHALGFVADLALAIDLLLIMASLSALHATLTLPGIAGIILNIGMAVDGNIIIYERIKEELREGKTIKAAIDAGFRKAFRTIFDANFTTLIAAVALFYFGTGPIRGFAVTLSIGTIWSVFTAVWVTKAILDLLADLKIRITKVLQTKIS